MAVAIAVWEMLSKKSKQFIIVPPGKGKSRIVAALVVLLKRYSDDKTSKIHLIFPSERLMIAE